MARSQGFAKTSVGGLKVAKEILMGFAEEPEGKESIVNTMMRHTLSINIAISLFFIVRSSFHL
jgi:hypothetical protein